MAEIYREMDTVPFLKLENKDRRMRIATEVPRGVKFTLGSGAATTVFASQPAVSYEKKLLDIGKKLFEVQRKLLHEFAEKKGKVVPELKHPDLLQFIAGTAKKSSFSSHDDSGPLLVDIGNCVTGGQRTFTKSDLQMLTFVLCDHPSTAQVNWMTNKAGKEIATVKTGKQGFHWQLPGSQTYKHEVIVYKELAKQDALNVVRFVFSLCSTGWAQTSDSEVVTRLRKVGAADQVVNEGYIYTNVISKNNPLGQMVDALGSSNASTSKNNESSLDDDNFSYIGSIDISGQDQYAKHEMIAEEDKP